jgi:hypothetical protein
MSGIDGSGEVGRHAADSDPSIPRRALIARSSCFALGAAVTWSAPTIRTTVLLAGAAGTPAPTRGTTVPAQSDAEAAIADPGATGGGTLPLTGVDPKPLLIAGGAAIAAGGALMAIVHDEELARGDDSFAE